MPLNNFVNMNSETDSRDPRDLILCRMREVSWSRSSRNFLDFVNDEHERLEFETKIGVEQGAVLELLVQAARTLQVIGIEERSEQHALFLQSGGGHYVSVRDISPSSALRVKLKSRESVTLTPLLAIPLVRRFTKRFSGASAAENLGMLRNRPADFEFHKLCMFVYFE